jgi:hypothetical protein
MSLEVNMDFTTVQVSQAVPSEASLEHAKASLITLLPEEGFGVEHVKKHVLNDIAPGFTGSNWSLLTDSL